MTKSCQSVVREQPENVENAAESGEADLYSCACPSGVADTGKSPKSRGGNENQDNKTLSPVATTVVPMQVEGLGQ